MESFFNRLTAYFANPRNVLLLAGLIGFVSVLSYACFSFDIYRDVANCYAYMAREFGRQNWEGGFHPRLPQLNIVLAGCLCLLGAEAYTATILVSGGFFLLTIPVLYPLLKRFLTPAQAAWGTLLYMAAPKMIRFAGTGLLESARNFFLVAAFLFLFRLADRRKSVDALWFGLALGGLALARSEGLVVALLLLAALPFLFFWERRKQPVSLPRAAGLVAFAAVVFLVTLAPSSWYNYRETGYPVIDLRIAEFFNPSLKTTPSSVVEGRSAGVAKRIGGVLSDLSRGAYEVYFALAILGALLLLKRRRWRVEYTLFVGVTVFYCVIYFAVVSAYRYYTLAIPLLMVFTMTGAAAIWDFSGRYRILRLLLVPGIAVVFCLQLVNGLEMAFRSGGDLCKIAHWMRDSHTGPARLRLVTVELPELTFWSDAVAVNGYGRRVTDWGKTAGFDWLAVRSNDGKVLAVIEQRPDLERVEHPYSPKILLFRPRGNP